MAKNHDPMCPVPILLKEGKTVAAASCKCEEYARVREDERAAALRDAVEAIPHDRDCDAVHYDEPCNCWRSWSVDAIEALGGERVSAPSNEELAGRILARVFTLTWDEYDALYDAWDAIPWADRRGAIVGGAALSGALVGAFTLDVGAVSSNAGTLVGAALAVLARDSRSESGPFTPAHYEILTRPWRQVIGAVHPDDDLPVGEAIIDREAAVAAIEALGGEQ